VFRIDADVLIPGRGDPVSNGSVVIDRSRIVYAGARDRAPSAEGAESFETPVVMPGMWDCHGHFMGLVRPNIEDLISLPQALAAARGLRDASLALRAGFTSIREPGGLGVLLARAIDEGTAIGPHIYGAGRVLSQTGGHSDIHALPLDVVTRTDLPELCDGVPECLKAVRKQLRMGAKFIKICASGGVMSEIDHPIHQQFSAEELQAIVAEAARAARSVAAHCHGKSGIMAALRAGARTIEHGTYLDEEAAELMIAQDAILVPTRFIVERLLPLKDELPSYAYTKIVMIADRHLQALRLAIEAGVRIAAGTDMFTTGYPWGTNGTELRYLVEAGMTPLAAIEAATANGPATLGPQAPRSGLLAEGYVADVIAVSGNPLDDIGLLGNAESVTHVWKSGELVKQP
jgi:imidazolonepropionase-like amidohydrolase